MASEEVPAKTFRNSAEQQIWLEELCSSNGLDYCDKADYKHTEELEMFLNGIPIIPSLHQFSGLIKLCLVGHQISKIENLKLLSQLEELWLCECSIQIIEGLDANTMLKKLYLYDNMIEKIQNLSHLLKLEVLWLNGNEIAKIEGIANLDNLREVNLAENKISEIGHTFDGNKKLVSINLSGNLITSFKDLTNLCNLPCLKSLSFKEPLYRANPVSLMCNYSTFILFHFPHLDFLDSYDVSQKTLKELAETTVAKKKLFYKMRLKTLERSYNEAVKKLEEAKTKLQSVPANMLCKVSFAIKQIERDQEEMKIPAKAMNFAVDETKELDSENRQDSQSPNQDEADVERTGRKYGDGDNHDNHDERRSDSSSGDELEELFERVNVRKEKLRTKLNALKERIGVWEKRRSEIEASYKEKCEQAKMITDAHVNRLFLELETVGNVRFEDGTNSDTWFNSVYELVMARFSEFDYKDLPVNSLKVQRIIKIYNKTLHTAFDDHLDEVRDKDDSIVTTRTSNRDFDYLFHISNQSSGDSDGERLEIIENGFKSPTDDSGHTCGIQLTNCVSIADKVRLKTLLKHVEKDDSKTQGYRHGQLLLCKTYIGRSTKASKNEKKINRVSFPNAESVYQTRRHAICPTKSRNKTSAAITDMCECPLRRCTWHVFNPKLILPEYLVEFEYGTRVKDPFSAALNSIFSQTQQNRSEENFDSTSIVDDKLMKIDEEILQTEPYIKVRPRLTVLTEDLLLRHTGASFINRITSLDLHGSGLSKLKPLSTLNHLRKLVVSFNELKTLQDLSGMTSLEYLDASFNKITSVDGFKGCIHLTFFDISWNRLHYTREEVGLMRKYLPALKLLNLKHNPWLKEETLRMRCIGRLRNLTRMDNEEVTEEETAMAVRMAACSRIAYITILAHSRTDVVKPRTLSLDSTASVLMQMSKNKPVKLFEDDKKWFYKVTCLQLDNQHLSKISNLEHLENLRFVSFNHNDITKIEGLENCPKIEELSLVGNCISKLEGIDHLLRLSSLNMSNNNLLTIDGTNFEKLAMLENLSFENNLISHLKSLQKAVSLTELYIGNNQIVNIREIFNLKSEEVSSLKRGLQVVSEYYCNSEEEESRLAGQLEDLMDSSAESAKNQVIEELKRRLYHAQDDMVSDLTEVEDSSEDTNQDTSQRTAQWGEQIKDCVLTWHGSGTATMQQELANNRLVNEELRKIIDEGEKECGDITTCIFELKEFSEGFKIQLDEEKSRRKHGHVLNQANDEVHTVSCANDELWEKINDKEHDIYRCQYSRLREESKNWKPTWAIKGLGMKATRNKVTNKVSRKIHWKVQSKVSSTTLRKVS
eukprot:gene11828-13054_t